MPFWSLTLPMVLQEKGKKAKEAIIEATSVRFRPILMTNLALIVGLLPIAFRFRCRCRMEKTVLGWVLIGGLASSMFLSMIIVPVLYILLDKLVKKTKKTNIQTGFVAQEVLENSS